MTNQTILWRRLDKPGHESSRLSYQEPFWQLAGTAVFTDAQRPCRLDYQMICNAAWHTLSARVAGWLGDEIVEVDLSVDAAHHWRLNGKEIPDVTGCLDLDLNFSPSTNLLPIRRLELAVGQKAAVKAAWLHFPSFTLEPLEQVYRRIGAESYHYESGGGQFVRELSVNAAGFVTVYPDFWEQEVDT